MIGTCNCANKFQDKLYGKGNRMHNPLKEDASTGKCTVCAKTNPIKQSNEAPSPKEKGKKK